MHKSDESISKVNDITSSLKLFVNLVDILTNEIKVKCRNIHLNLVESIKTRILEVVE